jgi:osmotically inducible protein OsmC
MPVRTADAQWEGSLQDGTGTMRLGSGAYEGRYSFASRFEDGPGTNPEELIGAPHAGCFSMALSRALSRAGNPPTRISTSARFHMEMGDAGFGIPAFELATEAEVPGLDEAAFKEQAETAKATCPVSKALAATEITLDAKLV